MTFKAFHNLALVPVWSTLPCSCSPLGPPSCREPLQTAPADTPILLSVPTTLLTLR